MTLGININILPTTINNCRCCPYGYHMDLDFVNYCEKLARVSSSLSEEQIQRRNRRRQRKSMNILLGTETQLQYDQVLIPNTSANSLNENNYSCDNNDRAQTENKMKSEEINDALKDVCVDFEKACEIHLKTNRNSVEFNSNIFNDIYYDINCKAKNFQALQAIREQMAESLKRTKYLEEQTKLVPLLKVN